MPPNLSGRAAAWPRGWPQARQWLEAAGGCELGQETCGHLQPAASTQGLLQALEHSPCRFTQRWLHGQSRCPTWRGQEECRRVHGSGLLAGERRRKALRPCPGGGRLGSDVLSPVQLSPGAPREHSAARSLQRSGSRARSRAAQARARCWGLGQVGPGAGKSFASPGARAAALIWAGLGLGLGLVRGYHGSHEAGSNILGMDLTLAGTGANTDSEVLWLNGTGECYRTAQPPLGTEALAPPACML